MATTTPNLGLTKQAPGERASLVALNGNFDLIDDFAGTAKEIIGSNKTGIANADANTYTTTGAYFFTTGSVNTPGDWGQLVVLSAQSASIIMQLYSLSGLLFYREYRNSTWSAWTQIAKANEIRYADSNIPVGTTAGAYKIGTFASLDIPSGSTILSVQCKNVTQSVCVVTGFAVSGSDIYVYIAQNVAVAAGQVTVLYKAP